MKKNLIKIYADGSLSVNPKRRAWTYIVEQNNEIIEVKSKTFKTGSSTRMELEPVIVALEKYADMQAIVYTDYSTLVEAITTDLLERWNDLHWNRLGGGKLQHWGLWSRLYKTMKHRHVSAEFVQKNSFHAIAHKTSYMLATVK